jgi:hypothetical protein
LGRCEEPGEEHAYRSVHKTPGRPTSGSLEASAAAAMPEDCGLFLRKTLAPNRDCEKRPAAALSFRGSRTRASLENATPRLPIEARKVHVVTEDSQSRTLARTMLPKNASDSLRADWSSDCAA